ncbi:unnamed protein product [Penicillium manginii]
MIDPAHRLRSTLDGPPRATTPDATPPRAGDLPEGLRGWETDRGIQRFVFGMLDLQCDKGVLDRMGTTNVAGFEFYLEVLLGLFDKTLGAMSIRVATAVRNAK